MSNVTLGFPNRIDTAAVSGGAWVSTLPLSNIKDRVQAKPARSTNAALLNTTFDVNLGVAQFVRVFSLVNHNFSLNAKVKITAASDAGFTSIIYQSSWITVWEPVYSTDNLQWEDNRWWDGLYSDEEKAGYTWLFNEIFPDLIIAQYWRIEIDDTTNASGYVQIGRVFIGDAWQASNNMSYGHSLKWETTTELQTALDDTEYFNVKQPLRAVNFTTEWLSQDEALGTVFEMQKQAGINGEVLFIHDPDDTIHKLRRVFLGRLRTLSPIEKPNLVQNSIAFEIKETR